MDFETTQISSADNNPIKKRKGRALAAAHMSALFLQNLQQMNLIATMAFIESSSDEDDDEVNDALLRQIKGLDKQN